MKYHILSVAGIQVYLLSEADILLAVNVGSVMTETYDGESVTAYDTERNLLEFTNYVQYALDKIVAIVDIAKLNTADTELARLWGIR